MVKVTLMAAAKPEGLLGQSELASQFQHKLVQTFGAENDKREKSGHPDR